MKVAILCEESGVVRDAFLKRGHDAISCDMLPTRSPGPHIQGDCRDHDWSGYDLLICHPPCTYLASMGVWWNHKRPERWELTYQAARFVQDLWAIPVAKMALENPIGWLNRNWQRPTQIIQPWQFGHEANKPTCLWLRGLSKLQPTKIVGKGEFYTKKNGARMSKWSHITSGTRKSERARIASQTFTGIAEAMADQWGSFPF